ncbi:MAG: Wzz/FepE/Etk N-terminal domain-containing protein [Pseudomonadota bacterium]
MSDTDRPIDIRDYIDAVLRRWYLFVLFVPVTSAVGLFVAYVLPPVYVAEARVLVQSQAVSENLVTATVTANTEELLKAIEQRMLTRTNLLGLVDKLELFSDRPDMTASDQVAALRAGTSLNAVATGSGQGRGIQAFSISHRSARPDEAAAIVNELVTLVLEENVEARSSRAAETTDFFKAETGELGTAIIDLESEISAFKRQHELSLPGASNYRRSRLSELQNSMFEREREVLRLEESRRDLQRTVDEGIDIDDVIERLSPEMRELRGLEQELQIKRSVFAESHPEVRNLRRRIETIRELIGPEAERDAEELVAEQRAQVQREIRLIDTRLDLIEKQQLDALAEQEKLESAISRAPGVEMELNSMTRRYTDLERRYQENIRKLSAAETGEKLEVNQQAERFELIERAEPPTTPVAPNRRLIAAAGFGSGFAAAFALIILAELMNQSIRTASDLERTLNLRPVVTIPYIETVQEVRRRIWRVRIITLVVLVVVPSSLYAVDQFYVPLELLFERFLERTGAMTFIDQVRERLAK